MKPSDELTAPSARVDPETAAEDEDVKERGRRQHRGLPREVKPQPPPVKKLKLPQKKGAKDVVEVTLSGATITVGRLSAALSVGVQSVLGVLSNLGEAVPKKATKHVVDAEVAELVATELGRTLVIHREKKKVEEVRETSVEKLEAEREAILKEVRPARPQSEEAWAGLPLRPPIVAVMGHVDHGKTTLLDAMRGSKRAADEAGGITQRLAAFEVEGSTFIDTPGHAAFAAMRSSSARALDVALIVVAADDGVKPQTLEALRLARERKAAVVFALTKCDKFSASELESARYRVRGELAEAGFPVEDDGGDAPLVNVSAPSNLGLDELRETVAAQAEVLELRADPSALAEGVVADVVADKHLGLCVDALIVWGSLKSGHHVVIGEAFAKVRRLDTPKAGPSSPCRIVAGLEFAGRRKSVAAGELVVAVKDDKTAKRLATATAKLRDAELLAENERQMLLRQQAAAQAEGEEETEEKVERVHAPVVVKVESEGEVDAVTTAIAGLPQSKVHIEALVSVGSVGRADVDLAGTFKCPVLAWSVGLAAPDVKQAARQANVEIRRHTIIYALLDEVRSHAVSMLPSVPTPTVTAKLQVLQLFDLSNGQRIAGCRVTDGTVNKSDAIRIVRGDDILHTDTRGCSTLKRFKDDVTSVAKGLECGLGFHCEEAGSLLEQGDILESFTMVDVPAKLEEE